MGELRKGFRWVYVIEKMEEVMRKVSIGGPAAGRNSRSLVGRKTASVD
jgi:hypothetical protein